MTTLSLENYACLLARLASRRSAEVEAALGELGLSFEDLERDELAILADLRGSFVKRKGVAAMKFAAALGEAIAEVGPLHAKGAGWPPLAPVAAPTPPFAFTSAPVALAAMGAPTSPWAAEARASAPGSGAICGPSAPPSPTLPEPEPAPATLDSDHLALRAMVPDVRLPFAPAPASLPPSLRPPSSAGRAARRAKRQGNTAAMPVWNPDGAPDSLPFGAAADAASQADPADLRRMPLDAYAQVSAALARGEDRDAVLGRHGLTRPVFEDLARGWARRFGEDPALLETFRDLVRSGGPPGRGS